MAKIGMGRAAGEYEVIERKFADIGRHDSSVHIHRFDVAQQHPDIRILREHRSNRRSNVGRTEAGHRHLIEKRLKQMVVPFIDQCHFNAANSTQSFRRIEPRESAADDDNPFHAVRSHAIMQRMIRNADLADLPAIVDIYNAAIPGRLATADTEPVTVSQRLPWFREHDPARRPLWVALDGERTLGWLSFQSFYGRPAYHATAELSVYVSPSHQRRGIARTLLTHAVAETPRLQLRTLLGFVFGHNAPS